MMFRREGRYILMAKKTKSIEVEFNRASDILKKLQSKSDMGDFILMESDIISPIPCISSGILSLDIILGGGYPHGRIIEIFGNEASGKTTTALHSIISVQQRGGVCAFIDAEHALDVSYASSMGVDMSSLLFSQPDNGEQAFEAIFKLCSLLSPGDLIVIDSVDALTPKKMIEGDMKDSFMGQKPLMMGQGIHKIVGSIGKSGVVVVFINQIRMKMGVSFGSPEETPGGKPLKFYATQRIDVRRGTQIKNGNDVVGQGVKFKIVKNKVAAPYKTSETQIRYGVGVPRALDVFMIASHELVNIISKKSSWFYYDALSLGNGVDNSVEFLNQNPEILNEIEGEILELYK